MMVARQTSAQARLSAPSLPVLIPGGYDKGKIMERAVLNEDGTYSHQCETGNIDWDANHRCPASSLTPEEAALFRVVPLIEVAPPAHDDITHYCTRAGGEKVNGVWQYAWTIVEYTAEQVAERTQSRINVNIGLLWQAAHDYEYAQINGTAIGMLAICVMLGKPKAMAVKDWCHAIWTLYYTRRALVTHTHDRSFEDFSSCGAIPHSMPELMAELGM